MSETSSDAESSCGWTIISNEVRKLFSLFQVLSVIIWNVVLFFSFLINIIIFMCSKCLWWKTLSTQNNIMPSTILFLDLFIRYSRLANPHVCTRYRCKNKTNENETNVGCALKAIFADNWLQFLFSACGDDHTETFLVSDQLADVLQKSVLTFLHMNCQCWKQWTMVILLYIWMLHVCE